MIVWAKMMSIKIKMKTKIKFVSIAVLCILLLSSATGAAFAASTREDLLSKLHENDDEPINSNVDFFGKELEPIWGTSGDVIVVYSNGGESIADLFGTSTKELEPGKSKTVKIRLENHSDEEYTFYLRATALTGFAARVRAAFYNGKTASDSLLEAINISIDYKGENLYNGGMSGSTDGNVLLGGIEGDNSGIPLGTLSGKTSEVIDVTISVPGWLGNEYMNTLCAVDWWFTAQQEDIPGPPVDPNPPVDPPFYPHDPPDPPTTAAPPSETIIDPEDPPTTEAPDIDEPPTEFDPEKLPLDDTPDEDGDVVVVVDPGLKLPKTGGVQTFVLPAAIILVLLSLLLLIVYKKDRKI